MEALGNSVEGVPGMQPSPAQLHADAGQQQWEKISQLDRRPKKRQKSIDSPAMVSISAVSVKDTLYPLMAWLVGGDILVSSGQLAHSGTQCFGLS